MAEPGLDAGAAGGRATPHYVSMHLQGFARAKTAYCQVARPERQQQLLDLVRGASQALLARGGGCAYGDAALNDGGAVIDLTRLDRLLGFDAAAGVLEAEAGIRLAEIDRVFLPRGLGLAVAPGSSRVTLGGAIAADVHGKNHDRAGSFGDHILWLDLLDAKGEVRRLAPDREPEIFAATIGGLGTSGIVLRAGLRLVPVPSVNVVRRVRRIADLDSLLANLEGLREHASFSVAWIDGLARGRNLGRAVLETAEPADAASKPRAAPRAPRLAVPFDLPRLVPMRLLMSAANAAYHALAAPGGRSRLIHRQAYFYPLDALGAWNRLYGKRGFAQFQCVVSDQAAPKALRAMLELVTQSRSGAFLGMIKTLGGEGRGHLSFARRGVTMALDLPRRGGSDELMARLIGLCLEHGGRVNPVKDAHLTAADFRAMYPRWERQRAALEMVDPEGRFQSDLARRLALRDYLP